MGNLENTRSPMLLNIELFRQLFKLTADLPWLKKKDEPFIKLLEQCKSTRERDLLIDLVSRWHFLDSSHLDDATTNMSNQICEVWKLQATETVITAIADSNKPDGSQALIQALKNKLPFKAGWKESNFCNTLTGSLQTVKTVSNVVLVDDFTGTGIKLERKLKWYQNKLNGLVGGNLSPRIYFCGLACMNIAKPLLDKTTLQEYYSHLWLDRGISDHYSGVSLNEAISDMQRLESDLSNLPAGYSLGYGKSEALYAQEPYNVPNNVFPIFWWNHGTNGTPRVTLFRRSEED